MTDEILADLNPEQRAAVEHHEGPMLVVAGAGTGKTRVITRRIAYLIETGRARPQQVLALTFTEKAAREMEERLYELIGWESFQVPVMTFNAFGAELLGRFATHIGRSINGGLLNETQKALLLQQQISRIELGYYGPQQDMFEFVEGIVAYIGQLQNCGIAASDYEAYVAGLERSPGDLHPRAVAEQVDLARLYRLYETVKLETGSYDYYDQLHIPVEILQHRPNLVEQLRREYHYLLVDEYQDTNPIQDQLLRLLVPPDGNLFAVGDDDQAIYGFRGADIRNILSFSQHFRVASPVVLVRNYRSGQPILDAAYRMIVNNNPDRLEARLGIDKHLQGEAVESQATFSLYATTHDETEAVAAAIGDRIVAGEQPAEIAVLAAQHATLSMLARALRRHGIPFALSTRVTIFEQPELIGLWYLLRWLSWQADETAIGHVVMGPVLNWPAERFRRLLESSREHMVSLEEALSADEDPAAAALMSSLAAWRGWAREVPVSQLLFKLVFETDLADTWRLKGLNSPRMIRVFEDLQRWLTQIQDFETVALSPVLAEYVATFPKPPGLEVSEPIGDSGGVQLLTVHAAKGLEFDSVYLIGCTQRAWSPGRVTMREVPEALRPEFSLPPEHEFRRLMYVAVTRARRFLQVSAATGGGTGGARHSVSRLAGELFGAPEIEAAFPASGASGGGDKLTRAIRDLQHFYPLSEAADASLRLPFETVDGLLDLSVTSLASYDFCPFEFYLEHVMQIKQPVGPQLAFGSVLHQVFERYYKARLAGRSFELPDLVSSLEELWSDRGYASQAQADSDRRVAREVVGQFFAREESSERALIGSEVPIVLDVPEARLRLRGKIDAIFGLSEGIELRDFKTGRTKTDPDKLAKAAKDSFQLRSYALAYQMLKAEAPARVVLDYVVTGVEGAAVLSDTILRNHRVKLAALADRIRARDFAPNPSPQHECAAIRFYGTGERDELLDTAFEAEGGRAQ